LTSTVSARTKAALAEVFEALFPSASVTGAPKRRSMEIIRDCEPRPRGVYTGAVGWLAPGRRASFGVAIRTAVVLPSLARAVYGIGSGIVSDSRVDGEWDECLLKARILEEAPFALVETFALLPGEGFRRLDWRHQYHSNGVAFRAWGVRQRQRMGILGRR